MQTSFSNLKFVLNSTTDSNWVSNRVTDFMFCSGAIIIFYLENFCKLQRLGFNLPSEKQTCITFIAAVVLSVLENLFVLCSSLK